MNIKHSAGSIRNSLFLILLISYFNTVKSRNIDYTNPVGKPLFGFSFNNSWTKIVGSNLDYQYVSKPSLGMHLRSEYYFKPWLGLGIAAGIQQRGSIFKTPDYDQSLGNPDSTYRHRIRFNCLDVPVYLILKSPKDLFKGVRPSLQLGINWHRNFQSRDVFISVEDGFHNKFDASDMYYVNAKPSFQGALGFDINAGTCLFQLQFIYNKGTNNVYNSPTFNGKTGYNSLLGIQFSVLY